MKKILPFAFLLAVIFIGCAKDEGCTPVEPKAEEAQILAFASTNGIDSLKNYNGVYYKIIEQGSGNRPTRESKVTVMYKGRFLNGTTFDESTAPVTFGLYGVIEGWQIGIPLIQKGGRIHLIIPSSYGYGCNPVKDNNQVTVIPANSVLDFDVTLINVE